MRQLLVLATIFALASCGSQSPSSTATSTKLPDGTLAIDSGQDGEFEITVLPLDIAASWEGNEKATRNSSINIEIDGDLRVEISRSEVIRIQGLTEGRHSVVEFVDGSKTSSFLVDGSTAPRMVADYYEMYGSWMVREPIEPKNAEQGGGANR